MSAAASSVPRRSLGGRLWSTVMVVLIAFFVVNVFGVITSVTVSSFATRWLGTWLPSGWTTRWYRAAWAEFQLDEVLLVTMEIVLIVVALGLIEWMARTGRLMPQARALRQPETLRAAPEQPRGSSVALVWLKAWGDTPTTACY